MLSEPKKLNIVLRIRGNFLQLFQQTCTPSADCLILPMHDESKRQRGLLANLSGHSRQEGHHYHYLEFLFRFDGFFYPLVDFMDNLVLDEVVYSGLISRRNKKLILNVNEVFRILNLVYIGFMNGAFNIVVIQAYRPFRSRAKELALIQILLFPFLPKILTYFLKS